jgi:hypothetical protein
VGRSSDFDGAEDFVPDFNTPANLKMGEDFNSRSQIQSNYYIANSKIKKS